MEFGDVVNAVESENQVQPFEDENVKRIKSRIALLEEALKYTKKSMLIKKHKKELVFLKTELHVSDFANQMMNYFSKLSIFVRSQV